jgi:hypothetical protein
MLARKPDCTIPNGEIQKYITIDFSPDFPANLKDIFKTNIGNLFPYTNTTLLEGQIPDYVNAGYKIICNYLPFCYYLTFDKSTSKIVINLFLNYKIPDNFESFHELFWPNFGPSTYLPLTSASFFILPTFVNLNALSYKPEILNKAGGNHLIAGTEYSVTYLKNNNDYLRVFYTHSDVAPQSPVRSELMVVSVSGYPVQEIIYHYHDSKLDPPQTIDGKLSKHGLIYKFFETEKVKANYVAKLQNINSSSATSNNPSNSVVSQPGKGTLETDSNTVSFRAKAVLQSISSDIDNHLCDDSIFCMVFQEIYWQFWAYYTGILAYMAETGKLCENSNLAKLAGVEFEKDNEYIHWDLTLGNGKIRAVFMKDISDSIKSADWIELHYDGQSEIYGVSDTLILCYLEKHSLRSKFLKYFSYLSSMKYDSAETGFLELQARCPSNVDCVKGLYICNLAKGDTSNARKFLFKCAELTGHSESIKSDSVLLSKLPKSSILFTTDDANTYPFWILQTVGRVRPDVTVVSYPLLRYGTYIMSRNTWAFRCRFLIIR